MEKDAVLFKDLRWVE